MKFAFQMEPLYYMWRGKRGKGQITVILAWFIKFRTKGISVLYFSQTGSKAVGLPKCFHFISTTKVFERESHV